MNKHRLTYLKDLLIENNLDAALISSVPNITYLTGYSNFSTEEREAYVLVTKKQHYILTDARYSTAVKDIQYFELVEVGAHNTRKQALESLIQKHSIKILGIEENNLFVSEYKTILALVAHTKHFSLTELRIKKSQEEIEKIEKACQLGDKTFAYIIKEIHAGITEKHIAFLLEKYIREHEAEPSFKTIIAFNANAAIPHHQTGNTRLGKKGLVLMDFGVKFENYCSDMTRTVFLSEPTPEQRRMYETVLAAQNLAIQQCNNRTIEQWNNKTIKQSKQPSTKSVDEASRKYIISQGYPSIPHSLGHGIGLEVHESPTLSPNSSQMLEEGMVFSIEPGIYLPGNAGVRIEDLFVIEKNSLRQLTQSPRELITL